MALGFDRGFWTITIAHITFTMCFAAVVVQARLQDFDKSVEEAAMDLGATPLNTFFQVTLPIIAPSVISAWLLSFTLSLDDLVIASFTTGPGATTLPMKIYSQVRLGVTPEINAISTLLIGIVTIGVLSAAYLHEASDGPGRTGTAQGFRRGRLRMSRGICVSARGRAKQRAHRDELKITYARTTRRPQTTRRAIRRSKVRSRRTCASSAAASPASRPH